ncbi:hypothetical protein SDC9_168186 [bioreactor metagenome]|uniref:Uncharacterized protein n=1 Tax=bioreactor metagenome TaxID=1076179 RepID=A0A645G1U3_9ZZZZ
MKKTSKCYFEDETMFFQIKACMIENKVKDLEDNWK